MGDLLPAINVDQLTMSVNSAVSGGVLPPFPLLPPPPTSVLPPASFAGVSPALPCVPVARLPPLPVFSTPSAFQISPPESTCSSPVYSSTCASHLTGTATCNSMSIPLPATPCVQSEHGQQQCVCTSSNSITNNNQEDSKCNRTNDRPPSVPSLPLTLPVSMPGCPPMLIMFSLRLPMPDITSGVSREMTSPSPSVGSTPRLPPFPPPFPLLFPIMPSQDGRHSRPLLPYPDLPPPIQASTSPQTSSLPLPPVSFPQGGLPLPPLPLQLPSSLTLPPLLHQPPVPISDGTLASLPSLLPQPVTSTPHTDLTLPPLVPLPSVTHPQTNLTLPPLLPTPSTSESHNSLPLPPFPPQSFTSFVQSGLPLTTLSPSSLPLPPLLPHHPPASIPEGSIGLHPLPQLTPSTTENCLSKMTALSPSNIPLVSLTQGSFPPLPPLPAQDETATSLPLPPQISIPLPPPLTSPAVGGPHSSVMFSLAGQNGFPPPHPLPGQLFHPLPFIHGSPGPHFVGQMSRRMAEDCSRQEDCSQMGEEGKSEPHTTGALRPSPSYGEQFEEAVSTLADVEANTADSFDSCESRMSDSCKEQNSHNAGSFDAEDKSKSTSFEREIKIDDLHSPSTDLDISDKQVSEKPSAVLRVQPKDCHTGLGKFSEGESNHGCTLPETATIRSQDLVEENLRTVCDPTFMDLAGQECVPREGHKSSNQNFPHFPDSGNDPQLLPSHLTSSIPSKATRSSEQSHHPMLDQLSGFVQTFGDHSISKLRQEVCLSSQCMETQHCSQSEFLPVSQEENYSARLASTYPQMAQNQVFDASGAGNGTGGVQPSRRGEGHNMASHFLEQTERTQQTTSHPTISQLQQSLSNRQPAHSFDLSSLSLEAENQGHTLLNHSLSSVQQLRESNQSLAGTLTDPLSSSCEVQNCSLQNTTIHSHLPQPSANLLSTLSVTHHGTSHLGSSFTALTGEDVDEGDMGTAVSASIRISTAGISSSDSSYPFQNGLPSDFGFPAPCSSSPPLIQQQQQTLLPSVGYSPPGLSNQGLSPNLFSSMGMGGTEQSAVDKDSQNLQLVRSSSLNTNLGLPNMSVLDMLLKTDLTVSKTSDAVPNSSVQKTALLDSELPSLTPLFAGHYCVECNKIYQDICQHHGARYYSVSDAPLLSKARATLPSCLTLGESSIVGHLNNTGVFSKGKIQANTEFGPLQGKILTTSETPDIKSFSRLKIFYEEATQVLDISDENLSNWLMFLKPARNSLERNLVAFQRGSSIVYVTCKDITPGAELLFWFSNEYARMMGLASKRATASSQYCPCCPVCSHVFIDQKQLRQHRMKEHRDLEESKWPCTLCTARFQSSSRLNSHVRSQHMHLKPFSCQMCGKAFSDGSNLRTHMALHRGVKKFTCDVCNQSFMQKAHLQTHQAIHTGAKTAQCRYCGKRFSRTSDMRQHEFQHSKEKTWNCQQCSKTFHRPTLLRRHMKVHNNEKNYVCEFCTKRFYTKFHLTRHSRSCKGLKPTQQVSSSITSSVSVMMSSVSAEVASVSFVAASDISLPLSSEEMGELPSLPNTSSMLSLSALTGASQQEMFNPVGSGNSSVAIPAAEEQGQTHLYGNAMTTVSTDYCQSRDSAGQ